MYLFNKENLQLYLQFRRDFALFKDKLRVIAHEGNVYNSSKHVWDKGLLYCITQNDYVHTSDFFELAEVFQGMKSFKLNIPVWEDFDARFIDNLFNTEWKLEYNNLEAAMKINDAINITIEPEEGFMCEYLMFIDVGVQQEIPNMIGLPPQIATAVASAAAKAGVTLPGQPPVPATPDLKPIINLKRTTCGLPDAEEACSLMILSLFQPLHDRFMEKVKNTLAGTKEESHIVEQMLHNRNMAWRDLMGI